MSSFHQKEAQTHEPYPCTECGKITVRTVVENCELADGTKLRNLRHLKCSSCGARLFPDDAMHVIQAAREGRKVTAGR